MKTIYLAGMAPPKDKDGVVGPFPSGGLTNLVPLDPRHGVFPNLVMTPLLGVVSVLHEENHTEAVLEVLEQVQHLLSSRSDRRFNVLKKPTGTHFEMDDDALRRLERFDPENEIWVVFNFSTINAIVTYLLKGETSFTKGRIDSIGREFLRHATEFAKSPVRNLPSNATALNGIYFRLCLDADPTGTGALATLRHAVQQTEATVDVERTVKMLRSMVPLLHNEAYQNTPFGKIQNCFMLCSNKEDHNPDLPPSEVYWRYTARGIVRALGVPQPGVGQQ